VTKNVSNAKKKDKRNSKAQRQISKEGCGGKRKHEVILKKGRSKRAVVAKQSAPPSDPLKARNLPGGGGAPGGPHPKGSWCLYFISHTGGDKILGWGREKKKGGVLRIRKYYCFIPKGPVKKSEKGAKKKKTQGGGWPVWMDQLRESMLKKKTGRGEKVGEKDA